MSLENITFWESWGNISSSILDTSSSLGGSSYLSFPSNLPSDRPVLYMRCNTSRPGLEARPATIILPAPPSIENQNSASYDGFELGITGQTSLSAFNDIKNSTGVGDTLASLGEASSNTLRTLIESGGTGAAAVIASQNDNAIGKALSVSAKAVLNPNITTAFTGVGTRSFTFTYKLVPETKKESETITNIIKTLTLAVYPEAQGFTLRYPPTWTIRFLKNITSREDLPSVNRIYECYIENFNVTYNSNSNAYHDDGTPVETDISFSVKETKALNANDILKLNSLDGNATYRSL